MVCLLDTNCLIDLEKGTGPAADLRQLVEAHRRRRIELVAAAVTASGRMWCSSDESGAHGGRNFFGRFRGTAAGGCELVTPLLPT